MKNKWLWVGGLLGFLSFCGACITYALPSVYLSSNTATADTTQALCTQTSPGSQPHGIVHTVCINTGTAGTLTLYNANGSGVNRAAAISTANVGCQIFDVALSSGITYTNSATANVTISYQCY